MLHNLLYLEHEVLKWVFRVPQSVQKVKTTKFNKPWGIMEQNKWAFKSFFKGLSEFPRFKKKKDSVGIYFPKNNETDFSLERHKIKVPTIGFC